MDRVVIGALFIILPLAMGVAGIFIENGMEALAESKIFLKNLAIILIITSPFSLIGLWILSRPIEDAYVFNKEKQEYSIESRSLFKEKKNVGRLEQIKTVRMSKSLCEENAGEKRYIYCVELLLGNESSSSGNASKSLFSMTEWESNYPLTLATTISSFLNLPEPQMFKPDPLADVDKWFDGIADKVDKKLS